LAFSVEDFKTRKGGTEWPAPARLNPKTNLLLIQPGRPLALLRVPCQETWALDLFMAVRQIGFQDAVDWANTALLITQAHRPILRQEQQFAPSPNTESSKPPQNAQSSLQRRRMCRLHAACRSPSSRRNQPAIQLANVRLTNRRSSAFLERATVGSQASSRPLTGGGCPRVAGGAKVDCQANHNVYKRSFDAERVKECASSTPLKSGRNVHSRIRSAAYLQRLSQR